MKKASYVLFLIFVVYGLPSIASATVLDSCDSLTPANGNWAIIDDYGGNLGSNEGWYYDNMNQIVYVNFSQN